MIFSTLKLDLNLGAFMNFFRLALPAALILALSVNIFAQDEEEEEEYAPRGGKGTITIITDPPNSDVFLDGEPLGKSPIIKRQFHSGPLRLIVQEQNKDLVNKRVNVWPGKENKFEFKTVMPSGTIKITTNPSKCRIYLDKEDADRTEGAELVLNNVDAGDHTVGADCGGKLTHEVLVTIKGEQTTVIHLDVQKKKSTIKTIDRDPAKEQNE